MPATAAARRTAPARTARAEPARSPRPQPRRAPQRTPQRRTRRTQATPIPGRFVAVGVGRTAGAVGGIADSGLVVRLTRGRLWIGLLAGLLVGIVALNVVALGLNASSSKLAQQADGLQRANSALRAKLASELTPEQVESTALASGLMLPGPQDVHYLRPAKGDAARAAERLNSGELTTDDVVEATTPAVVPVTTTDPAVAPPTATTATVVAPAPTVTTATTADTATASTDPSAAGGGVSAP
jgi:hypothetical protein